MRMERLGPGTAAAVGSPGGGSGAAVELRDILHVLGKWKGVMALVVAAAVGTTGVVTFFVLPKVYRATATVNMGSLLNSNPNGQSTPTVGQATDLQGVVNSVSVLPAASLQTYQWEMTSPSVLASASKALKAKGIDLPADAIGGMVSPGAVAGTSLVTISATNHDPRLAATIANAVAQAFITDQSHNVAGRLAKALTLLKGQASSLGKQLGAASAKLAKDEERPGASAVAGATIQADTGQMSSLAQGYAQAKVKLQSALGAESALQASLRGVPATIRTSNSTSTTSASPQANPAYQSLKGDLAKQAVVVAEDQARVAELQREMSTQSASPPSPSGSSSSSQSASALASAYAQAKVSLKAALAGEQELQIQIRSTPKTLAPTKVSPTVTVAPNPVYQSLSRQLSAAQVTVAEERAAVAELGAELPTLQNQLQNLQGQSTAAQAAVASAKYEVKNLSSAYQTLTAKITATKVQEAVATGKALIQLDAPATTPSVPVSPRKKLDLALSLLVGLVAACGVAFLLEQLDNTVKNPEDVRRAASLPTLAVIPFVRG